MSHFTEPPRTLNGLELVRLMPTEKLPVGSVAPASGPSRSNDGRPVMITPPPSVVSR